MIIILFSSFIIGLLFSLIFGIIFLPYLKKLNVFQNVSTHLNKRHMLKNKTPTMGGLIFVVPSILIIIFLIVFQKINISSNLLLILFVFMSYAILGFMDDFLKIKYHNNSGLSIILKFLKVLYLNLIFHL